MPCTYPHGSLTVPSGSLLQGHSVGEALPDLQLQNDRHPSQGFLTPSTAVSVSVTRIPTRHTEDRRARLLSVFSRVRSLGLLQQRRTKRGAQSHRDVLPHGSGGRKVKIKVSAGLLPPEGCERGCASCPSPSSRWLCRRPGVSWLGEAPARPDPHPHEVCLCRKPSLEGP